MTIVPVLMAGGSGTRLWPLSRELYPKQFLRLLNDQSLLQNAALRAARIENAAPPVALGGEAHRFLIAEQLQEAGIADPSILLEPEGRNTAPAAAVAAHFATEKFGAQSLVFLMPADQAMEDVAAFLAAVKVAAPIAAQGRIVTFGISPTRAATGFGWLKAGAPIESGAAFEVSAFIEKPDRDKAEGFLNDGGYYWNGGMFLFRADVLLGELQRLEPEIHRHTLAALTQATRDIDFVRLQPQAFKSCRNVSIDHAVMERTRNIALVPLDAGWDDVGSWTFMEKLPGADEHGNHAKGDVLLEDASGNLVYAASRLVAIAGVNDHIVVETEDAVLVTTREQVENVKRIVQRLKTGKRSEAEIHPRVYRPWGYYETIALAKRFQVKRIMVKPGHKLSLQMHHHRAEHWVVVSGTARVTCNGKEFALTEDQSTYIPLGHKHRLENPGKEPLEIIEVQSGSYLGEDDIVRFDDAYGRVVDKEKLVT